MANEMENSANQPEVNAGANIDDGETALPNNENVTGKAVEDDPSIQHSGRFDKQDLDNSTLLIKTFEGFKTVVDETIAEIKTAKTSAKIQIGGFRNDAKQHHDRAIRLINDLSSKAGVENSKLDALKKATEDSLTQVAEATETAKNHIAVMNENKQNTELIVEALGVLRANAEENLKQTSESRNSAEENAKLVAQLAEKTEENKDSTKRLLGDVQKNREDAIVSFETIKKHETNIKLIAERAKEKDEQVDEYQQQLETLIVKSGELKTQIENLLPGATSANLASAFEKRKKCIRNSKRIWSFIQISAVGAFIIVGWYVFVHEEINGFRDLIFYALKRSPILAGIILLEEFARRNYNIALRLEEDYGYKEVLSRSFTGYRKQMEEIEPDNDSAVSKLSNDLLVALAQQPGRLIDKEKQVFVPSADIIEQVAKAIAGKKDKKQEVE